MATCPQCGTEGEANQISCVVCGTRLPQPGAPVAAAGAAGGGHMLKTMLGMPATPPPAGGGTSSHPPPAAFGHTMLGLAPSSTPPPTQLQASAGPALDPKRTLLGGMGAPFVAAPAPSKQPQVSGPASTRPGGTLARAQGPELGLGNRTILGVARPGIAPLNPGVAKPASLPPPETDAALDLDAIPGLPQRSGEKRGLLPALLALGLAGIVITGALLFWRSVPPLSVSVELANDGTEVLKIDCADCADGSVLSLGSQRAKFKQHTAVIKPTKPLQIGTNQLAFEFSAPGGKPTNVEIAVPIRYRVTPKLGRLSEMPPVLEVRIEAANAVSVSIAGKPQAPNAQGVASLAIDVSEQVTGQASELRPLERRVPYELTFSDSPSVKSEALFQLGIVPLRIEAPGESITIEQATFRLAGQTQPGGSVSVSGRNIPLNADGSFSQIMKVSAPGATTFWVRASRAGLAPRLVPMQVKRVASLSAEAKMLDSTALTSYSEALSKLAAYAGRAIAWQGKVVEARKTGNAWVILIDASSGCTAAPCLLRVGYGGDGAFDKGQAVAIYGVLQGAVEGPRSGTTIPVVRADFIL